ncbi:hypothetical protein BD413DRAFT_534584 [Trametes elegans]|nr:hypothetical protein BD413DRAFT_534584 [Trametes elegans]
MYSVVAGRRRCGARWREHRRSGWYRCGIRRKARGYEWEEDKALQLPQRTGGREVPRPRPCASASAEDENGQRRQRRPGHLIPLPVVRSPSTPAHEASVVCMQHRTAEMSGGWSSDCDDHCPDTAGRRPAVCRTQPFGAAAGQIIGACVRNEDGALPASEQRIGGPSSARRCNWTTMKSTRRGRSLDGRNEILSKRAPARARAAERASSTTRVPHSAPRGSRLPPSEPASASMYVLPRVPPLFHHGLTSAEYTILHIFSFYDCTTNELLKLLLTMHTSRDICTLATHACISLGSSYIYASHG